MADEVAILNDSVCFYVLFMSTYMVAQFSAVLLYYEQNYCRLKRAKSPKYASASILLLGASQQNFALVNL